MSERTSDYRGSSSAQTEKLLALLRHELPRRTESEWEAYASMLLVRSAGTLRSIATLRPGSRTLDAAVLLRALLDHVTLFAWIGIDPPSHVSRWKAGNARIDVREHEAWEPYGVELLDREALAATRTLASGKGLPNVAQRAAAADDYWMTRVPGIAAEHHPTSLSSFRSLYRVVFRLGSVATHPSVAQGSHFLRDGLDGTVCHWEKTPAGPAQEWWEVGPYILALGLLVASEALGWPSGRAVARAVGRESALFG